MEVNVQLDASAALPPLDRKLLGPRTNMDSVEKNLLPLLRIEPRFFGQAHSLITIPTELCSLSISLLSVYIEVG
jgi:hypothetical protein